MELKMISIDEIEPNPFQPRDHFDQESLEELADSMKDANVIQPIVVRRQRRGYEIVVGERRWIAAQIVGLKEIPCIIRDIPEERVLLESLIENLHRKDLTDPERENAIHELWENREKFGIKTKVELARRLGMREAKVHEDIDAWEFRHKEKVPMGGRTRGLEPETRKLIIQKVETEEIKASEVDTVAKVIRRGSEPIKQELLKPKSRISPKMAEAIIAKLPTEEEQKIVVEEIKRFRLTEDEVED